MAKPIAAARPGQPLSAAPAGPPAATTPPAPARADRSPCRPPGPASAPPRCRHSTSSPGQTPAASGGSRTQQCRPSPPSPAAAYDGRRRRGSGDRDARGAPPARRGSAPRVLESCRRPRPQCRTSIEHAFDDTRLRRVSRRRRPSASVRATVCTSGWPGRSSTGDGQRQRPVGPVRRRRACSAGAARRRRRRASPTAASTAPSPAARARARPPAPPGRRRAGPGRCASSEVRPRSSSSSVPGAVLPLLLDVRAGPQPGDRRQVVGGDRGHGLGRPLGRVVVLEPEQPVGEHAVLGHVPRGRRPRPCRGPRRRRAPAPGALQRDDVEQVLGRVADVGAVGRRAVGRHPPQPEQAHDVVDPQAAGAGDRGPDRLDERLVVGVAQPPRDQRRASPSPGPGS